MRTIFSFLIFAWVGFFSTSLLALPKACLDMSSDKVKKQSTVDCSDDIQVRLTQPDAKYPGATIVKVQPANTPYLIWARSEVADCQDQDQPCDSNGSKPVLDVIDFPNETNQQAYELLCTNVLGPNWKPVTTNGRMPLYASLTHLVSSGKNQIQSYSWNTYFDVKQRSASTTFFQEKNLINQRILKSFECRTLTRDEVRKIRMDEFTQIKNELNKVLPFPIPKENESSVYILDMSSSVTASRCQGIRCVEYIIQSMKKVVSLTTEKEDINIVLFSGTSGSIYSIFNDAQPMTSDQKKYVYAQLDQILQELKPPENLAAQHNQAQQRVEQLSNRWKQLRLRSDQLQIAEDTANQSYRDQVASGGLSAQELKKLEKKTFEVAKQRIEASNQREATWDKLELSWDQRDAIWKRKDDLLSIFSNQATFKTSKQFKNGERLDEVIEHANLHTDQIIHIFSDFNYLGNLKVEANFDAVAPVINALENHSVRFKMFGQFGIFAEDQTLIQKKEYEKLLKASPSFINLGDVNKEGDFDQVMTLILEKEKKFYQQVETLDQLYPE